MNLISHICEKLGIKQREVFKVKGKNAIDFKLDDCGVFIKASTTKNWIKADPQTLEDLITGKFEIIKLPYKG